MGIIMSRNKVPSVLLYPCCLISNVATSYEFTFIPCTNAYVDTDTETKIKHHGWLRSSVGLLYIIMAAECN